MRQDSGGSEKIPEMRIWVWWLVGLVAAFGLVIAFISFVVLCNDCGGLAGLTPVGSVRENTGGFTAAYVI